MFFERSGLHLFTWRGIDVFVSMWYMILMAFLVFFGGSILGGVMWALAVTISLLIHEFGHALVSQYYKLKPSILLHGFGGLCMGDPAATDGQDARVLLAGPGAGLVAGGVLFLLQMFVPALSGPTLLAQFVSSLIWINIAWSLFNLLLPVWPLDGGQLFHLLLRRFMDEDRAQSVALNVSIFIAIPVGILGYMMLKWLLIPLLFLFIIMDNINTLRSGQSLLSRPGNREKKASSFHEELLREAEAALGAGDWREAARVAHHMRAVGSMPQKMLDRVWTILGVATAEMGDHDEALSYLERAPDSREVREAIEKCQQRQSA